MKCTIPEISWHNRDPVLTVDIQKNHDAEAISYRLASGGTDSHVIIWQLCILDNGGVSVEMLSDLTRHNRPVNAVRFSPDGKILASSDDEAAIILWKKNEGTNDIFMEENENENKEHWSILKMLRGHIEDVYDLCWSSCSHFLISGSVDNSAILWDIQKGKSIGNLNDHKGFVQGVAWDPKGQFCATLCSDRCLRIFNVNTKKSAYKVQKCCLPSQSQSEDGQQKASHLFYDDTLKSFCRRLSFSPDGELLVAPSGIIEDEHGKYVNVVHVFARSMLSRPIMCFPTHDKFTIAVRFCPILFELRSHQNNMRNKEHNISKETSVADSYIDLFQLPYRMIFAVATQNAVLIYDTQQPIPFAKISNIHYTRISDLSWSSDGRLLVISSTDGYVSLASFLEGELGTVYVSPVRGEETSPIQKSQIECVKPSPKVCGDKENISDSESKPNTVIGSNKASLSSKKYIPLTSVSENKLAGVVNSKPENGKSVEEQRKKSKPGKRISLITLSSKTDEASSSVESPKGKPLIEKDVQTSLDDSLQTKEALPPSDEILTNLSPCSSQKLQGSKTPRRVSLITLYSPKSKIVKDKPC